MEFSSEDIYRTRYIPKFRILFPITLRKMEVHAETGAWKLASYIREGSHSGEICEHISALRLTKGRKAIIIVGATHRIEGAFPENIIIKNEATGNLINSFCLFFFLSTLRIEKCLRIFVGCITDPVSAIFLCSWNWQIIIQSNLWCNLPGWKGRGFHGSHSHRRQRESC